MSSADRCTVCGEIIPEARQVCPLCEKEEPMGNKNNPYFNSEGYADPTAFAAISSVTREENAELDSRVNFLIKVIKFIADGAGFDITNRIEIRDRKTGKEFK